MTVAGDHDLDINRSNPLVRDVLHSAYDISSVETDNLQRTDLTDSIVNANDSEEAPLEITESSEPYLAAMTASFLSLANLNEDGPMMVNISKLTTVKILDKRSNASRVEYERMRARAAMVGCRLGGKGADGTRLHPLLDSQVAVRLKG